MNQDLSSPPPNPQGPGTQRSQAGSETRDRLGHPVASATGMRARLAALGPGLLFAGTAVGVSHLVQSTRAGADYGFALLWVVLAANLFKYPAFEAATRWTAGTGRSLLDGYRSVARWILWVYLALTLATMFTVLAAVTIVTAGMASALGTSALSVPVWAAIILAACSIVLASNRFAVLDGVMKFMMLLLTVSTLVALSGLLLGRDVSAVPWTPLLPEASPRNIAFIAALIGWMPTAIDLSVWQSLWSLEKDRSEDTRVPLSLSLWDFNVGYIGATVLAVCFLAMGAGALYGTGQLPDAPGAFAVRFVEVYAMGLGQWAAPVMLVAAFTTMLSTTLTVQDGFPRAVDATLRELREPGSSSSGERGWGYWATLAVISAGALLLVSAFASSFKSLVDLATTLSFVTAPLFAWMNLKVLRSDELPLPAKPAPWLFALHYAGLTFMTIFAGAYLLWRFAPGLLGT